VKEIFVSGKRLERVTSSGKTAGERTDIAKSSITKKEGKHPGRTGGKLAKGRETITGGRP